MESFNRHAIHLGFPGKSTAAFQMGGVDALGAAQQIYVKHGNFGTSLSSSQMGWSGSSRQRNLYNTALEKPKAVDFPGKKNVAFSGGGPLKFSWRFFSVYSGGYIGVGVIRRCDEQILRGYFPITVFWNLLLTFTLIIHCEPAGKAQFIPISSWWFHTFVIFTPIWGRFPIWRAYFSNGLVQQPTRFSPSWLIPKGSFIEACFPSFFLNQAWWIMLIWSEYIYQLGYYDHRLIYIYILYIYVLYISISTVAR